MSSGVRQRRGIPSATGPSKSARSRSAPQASVTPRWLAQHPGKRFTEKFFLGFSVLWISLVAAIVATGAYEHFTGAHYMAVGLFCIVPCWIGPLLFAGQGEPGTPFWDRFFIKANVWLWIISFIGNWLWTHYFYTLLGAKYTFSAWRVNDVPFALFLITHAYFSMYHSLTTVLLRRFWTSPTYTRAGAATRPVLSAAYVALLAYVTAFMESLTIAEFPYYSFVDRTYMYVVGSACYGLYFIVSFPMYHRVQEDPADASWTLSRVALDSFACCMVVTMLLEAWRVTFGGVSDVDVGTIVPWLRHLYN